MLEEKSILRVAILQYAPAFKEVEQNQARVDELLQTVIPGSFDVLLLPELAFYGYMFSSLDEIEPFLEDKKSASTLAWTQKTAIRLQCAVLVGFPERGAYNSLLALDKYGKPLMSTPYRKTHLYETDKTWAKEGSGFTSFELVIQGRSIRIVPAICMDLNNKDFEAPWDAFELANHVLSVNAEVLLCANAWLDSEHLSQEGALSAWDAAKGLIGYWAARLEPLWGTGKSLVICNRTGIERDTTFAGTSCALVFGERPIVLDFATKMEERLMLFELPLRPAYHSLPSYNETAMLERLYVVRTADKAEHARPGFDERDVQLTSLGHSQSLDLECWAHGAEIDAVFCSPMFRALQTVDGAAGTLKLPIRLEESLGPWYLPAEANSGIHPAFASFDILRRSFFRISSKAPSLGTSASRLGETYEEMSDRVLGALHAIISYCDDNNLHSALLVTHAAPAIILSSVLGQQAALQEPFETAGMRCFQRAEEAADPLEGWRFLGKTKYLRSACAQKGFWSFENVDLVPHEGMRERDGGTDVAALAFALMHQHSPLHKGHSRRPSVNRHQTE